MSPPLDPRLLGVLEKKFGFTHLTRIQADSFATIIAGRDCLMRADTGSGKTIAYLLPVYQTLINEFPRESRPIERGLGPLAVIVSPTRELCQQIATVVDRFKSQVPFIVPGTLLGGETMDSEKRRIRSGINLLIGTPGRLVYHLENTRNLGFEHIRFLVLDEADRLLDMGFLGKVTALVRAMPAHQTVLVSATLHSRLGELQEVALKDPVAVGELRDEVFTFPATLEQSFVVVPVKCRLAGLAMALRVLMGDAPFAKVIVFASCCLSVDFHHAFFAIFKFQPFRRLEKPLLVAPPSKATILDPHAGVDEDEVGCVAPFLRAEIFHVHGNVPQIERAKAMSRFTAANRAVLFCTDVGARGLDIPQVSSIVSVDAPVDTEDYVHRVGRTARIGFNGESVLFLQPHEASFVDVLKQRAEGIAIRERQFDVLQRIGTEMLGGDDAERCFAAMRMEARETVARELETLAAQAWAATIASYTTHHAELQEVFDKRQLHLGHLAEAFGLTKTPAMLKEDLAEARQRRGSARPRGPRLLKAIEERVSEWKA